MFYLRIFPSDNFKKACYVVLVWIVICTVIIVLLTIFQCVPVSYNWLGWTGTQKPARCTNLNAQTYASSSINIIQDVVILVLPLPWLVKLNVGWRRKLNVLLMFSIGILSVSPTPPPSSRDIYWKWVAFSSRPLFVWQRSSNSKLRQIQLVSLLFISQHGLY